MDKPSENRSYTFTELTQLEPKAAEAWLKFKVEDHMRWAFYWQQFEGAVVMRARWIAVPPKDLEYNEEKYKGYAESDIPEWYADDPEWDWEYH